MNNKTGVVFLLDCDNTLLDNDHLEQDLRERLIQEFGPQDSDRYWTIFEQLRSELGYADYLGALQRFRQIEASDRRLLLMSSFLIDYPFASRLYPRALDAIRRLDEVGLTVILSDGDVVFQPRKLQRSGLWDAVGGRVLIYVHKETMLDAVAAAYPARHYVVVDDKLRLLTLIKNAWHDRVTTVFPRQGHYANDPAHYTGYPAADVTVSAIGELAESTLPVMIVAAGVEPR